MSKKYYFKLTFLIVILATEQHESGSPTITDTVLADINNAFKAVSKNSNSWTTIISKMFATSRDKLSVEPTLKFGIPGNQSTDVDLNISKMKRSDFCDPVFPNISASEMPLRLQKLQSVKTLSSDSDWDEVGLEGWTGSIYKPLVKESEHIKNEGSKDDVVSSDVNIKHIIVDPISLESRAESQMNSSDVYLARANNPFGFSTKWEMRLSNESSISEDKRSKRDAIRLYSMIKCSTGCEPLTYKGYGCYCGFLGNGVAVDGIDRCCKMHDKCYGQSNCISFLEYFVPYVWKCYRGKPLCAIDHGEWGGPDSCAAKLCECDLRLSRCLRKFKCPERRPVCTSSRTRRLQNLIYFL